MEDRFKLSRLTPQRLEGLGLSTPAVLRHAGLPLGLFEQPVVFVKTAELFAFWKAIEELSPRSDVGLAYGSLTRIEHYDPIVIAALYASSFRDALQRLARYKQLVCPEEVHINEANGEAVVSLVWLLREVEEPPSLVDMCFAGLLMLCQRGTGQALRPMRVELRRTEKNRQVYEDHFGCRVRFKASRNALVFRSKDLDRAFLTHNPEIFSMLGPQLEKELAEKLTGQSLPERVKSVIKRLIAGERPSIELIGRELGLSTRTLQRRLSEEGQSFKRLLEQARRELARHYLMRSELELNETAFLLGYNDHNSFFRAFQQWEGMSPGRWREEAKLNEFNG